jgi:hypothetical protein
MYIVIVGHKTNMCNKIVGHKTNIGRIPETRPTMAMAMPETRPTMAEIPASVGLVTNSFHFPFTFSDLCWSCDQQL